MPKKKRVKVEVKPLIEPPEEKEVHRPEKISVPAILEVNEEVKKRKRYHKKGRDN